MSDIVDAAVTPSGQGMWAVNAKGDVFAIGDAYYHGSPATPLEDPVCAILTTPGGRGYHLVTSTGQVHSFGDARPAPAPSLAST